MFGPLLWEELRALLVSQGVQPDKLDAVASLLQRDPLESGPFDTSGHPSAPTQEALPALQDTFLERRAGLSMALHLEQGSGTWGKMPPPPLFPVNAALMDATVESEDEPPTVLASMLLPLVDDANHTDHADRGGAPKASMAQGIRAAAGRLRPAALRQTEGADTRIMGAPSQDKIDAHTQTNASSGGSSSGGKPSSYDALEVHDPTLVVGLPKGAGDQEDQPRESEVFESVAERYQDLGLIGIGGMGEIRRMFDRNLHRVVAMKLLKPEFLHDHELVERFFEEAQVTAQLEHPGIIPTHEVGRWIDGRIYFTMREIRGQTLAQVLQSSQPGQDTRMQAGRSSWSLRRLLNLFQRACEAVGYAHDRGVVHRDIKPANMIVGAHGEIQVVDWGLVKRLLAKSDALPDGKAISVPWDKQDKAVPGILLGTPRYMSPEQILRPDDVDERSDVYALGIILYEILAGRTPYQDKSVRKILIKKMEGFPIPPGRSATTGEANLHPWAPVPPSFAMDDLHLLPDDLMEICARAMAPEADARYPNAGALAKVIEGWLAGLQKRRRAQEVVASAAEKTAQESALRVQVQSLRQHAQSLSQHLEGWEPEEEKWAAWQKEEEALLLEQRAESLLIESIQLLQGALAHEPEFVPAHLALAERYHRQHLAAEANGDMSRLLHAEARLRQHVTALPVKHASRLIYETYLQGDGQLTLRTEPARARVTVARFEPKGRRLVEEPLPQVLYTPIEYQALPYGSYLLTIKAEGFAEVRYPVFIERGDHWSATPPGSSEVAVIPLPKSDEVAEDECFVPHGWCLLGGDPEAQIPASRVWVDSYVIQRHPVTNQQYIDFLNSIVSQGREAEALRCVPRERAGRIDEVGAMIYGRLDDGSFVLRTDADGDTWQPDWPVIMVDWHGAVSYARWLRRQTGLPWRLPWEVEWEKAARGVDGRQYPWGNVFDPSWCCMRNSRKDKPLLGPIDEFPIDKSVYDVCGVGGNVGDWCLDLFTKGALFVDNRRFVPPENQHKAERRRRVLRGGNWSSEAHAVRFSFRGGFHETMRHAGGGIRLVRPLTPNTNDSSSHSQGELLPKRWF